jgi:hypothetical protein
LEYHFNRLDATTTLFNYRRILFVTIIFRLSRYQFSWAAQAIFSWLPNDPFEGTVGYILQYSKSSRNYTGITGDTIFA